MNRRDFNIVTSKTTITDLTDTVNSKVTCTNVTTTQSVLKVTYTDNFQYDLLSSNRRGNPINSFRWVIT
jgi:hypothetical protein